MRMDFEEMLDPRRPMLEELHSLRTLHIISGDEGFLKKMGGHARHLFDIFCESRYPEGPGDDSPCAFLDHLQALIDVQPTADELKNAPFLDRWCAIQDYRELILIGFVSGHPRLREGARARTSLVFQIRPEKGWARTWSRFFRIGEHSPMTFFEWQHQGEIEENWTMVNPYPLIEEKG